MRFRMFTGIFDKNPFFLILASYGQGLAPATVLYSYSYEYCILQYRTAWRDLTWPDGGRRTRSSVCTRTSTTFITRTFIVSLYVSDLPNVTISTTRTVTLLELYQGVVWYEHSIQLFLCTFLIYPMANVYKTKVFPYSIDCIQYQVMSARYDRVMSRICLIRLHFGIFMSTHVSSC